MNFYKRYMADYAQKTARLTLAQHGAYTLLLDEVYATESPLPAEYDELFRICRAMSKPEQEAVRQVADMFFPVGADGARHNARAAEEISEAMPALEAARMNGKRGGRPGKKLTHQVPEIKPTGFPDKNPVGFENETQTKPSAKPPHSSEEEEEPKGSLSGSSIPPCPIDRLVDAYAQHLPALPQPRRSLFRAGKGADAMRARWRWVMTDRYEAGDRHGQRMATTVEEGVAWFERFFAYVAKSDFLTGRDGKWTGCSLSWLLTASKFEAVLAGAYHQAERVAA
jgi:uncharacterized protein YdaU (DUF1376 family)